MNQVPQPCISTINISTKHHNKCLNYIIPYIMYQSKCINHAPNLNKMNYNQDVFPYMYAISTINHVPIILLASASNNVPNMYQSRINYRSSYDSSMMYNITTSSTHQLHVPICSSTTCQMHAPRHPTNMPLTIHHKIYQWSSHMYQPCTMTDLPQKPFTTTSTKQPIVPLNMY
jgi:hypothetical protein